MASSHRSKSRATAVQRVWISSCTACLLLLALLHPSMAVFYSYDPPNTRSFTSRCEPGRQWCGEKWRASRILYYNYTVVDKLVIPNTTQDRVETISNCSTSLISYKCKETSHSNTTESPLPERVKVIERASEPEIIRLPKSLSLGLILTDNINITGGLVQETYPLNQDKIWQIRIPPGCRMNIYFSEFFLESSPECKKDYFSVQTSKNQRDIPRYCDTLHRIEIRNRRRVQLFLHSDESISKRGISATVCLSNWPESNTNQLPCTCTPRRQRRQASSAEDSSYRQRGYRHLLRKRIAKEDAKVGRWLTEMMQGGMETIERFLDSPESQGQRYLAEKYMQALDTYEQQNSVL